MITNKNHDSFLEHQHFGKIMLMYKKLLFRFAHLLIPKPTTLLRPNGHKPIRVSLAGVMVENRFRAVAQLSLLEKVFLSREPNNQYDPNAIAVKRQDNKKLGYIGKAIAAKLASFMDSGNDPIAALITDITSDISGSTIGTSICFYLPEEIYDVISKVTQSEIDYCFETGNEGALNLLLNCDEAILNFISAKLTEKGLNWTRSSLSYRRAANGLPYRWYIRFENDASEEIIERFLKDELSFFPTSQELKEYLNNFDSENMDLKNKLSDSETELKNTKEELVKTQKDLESLERLKPNWSKEEIVQIIQTLLPNIKLQRNSADIVTCELTSCYPVLKLLHLISTDGKQLKGEKVESTNGWLEKHFNTGRKDDGRLYYKQDGGNWLVLVSCKSSQRQDIQWLESR